MTDFSKDELLVPDNKIRRIFDLVKALKRYCHSDRCSNIIECPESHDDCVHDLDLSTSIAWSLSNELFYLGSIISNANYEINNNCSSASIKASIHYVKDTTFIVIKNIQMLYEIVMRHSSTYERLFKLIEEVAISVDDVYNNINFIGKVYEGKKDIHKETVK